MQVVANGREDWIGWLELKTERVNEIATQNTARVIRDIKADVVGAIEVDNRIALLRFNDQLLPSVDATAYKHVMLIDGNDDRGIDVGVLSRFPIATMRSHVDDRKANALVFSRDCPEYEVRVALWRDALSAGESPQEQRVRHAERLEQEAASAGRTHKRDLRRTAQAGDQAHRDRGRLQ